MEKIKSIFTNGIYKKNSIFVMVLGMCPALAVSTSLTNALGMGVAVISILTMSNMIISAIRKLIPSAIRIPSYIGIIAAIVTIVGMLIQAYVPSLYTSLGIYLPLIVVNCIILERAESFASKNKVIHSMFDGIAVGAGFTLGLMLIAFFRELLGAGTLFGIQVLPSSIPPALIMILPPGAFIAFGILLGTFTAIGNYRKNKSSLKNKATSLKLKEGEV